MHRSSTLGPSILPRPWKASVQKWEKLGLLSAIHTGNPRLAISRTPFSKSRQRCNWLTPMLLRLVSTFQARTVTTSLLCISFIVLLRSLRSPQASNPQPAQNGGCTTLDSHVLCHTKMPCFPTDVLYRMEWREEPRIVRSGIENFPVLPSTGDAP